MDESGQQDPQMAADSGKPPPLLLYSLAGFARTLSGAGDPRPVMVDLAERASLAVGVTGAWVILLEGGRPVFSGASRPSLDPLGGTEEQAGEGPGVESALSGRTVAVSDLTVGADRWPGYAGGAARAGIRAVAAIPLRAGDATLGALNIYHSAPREWTDSDIRPARVLADLAAGYIALARRLEEQRRLAVELQQALDSRVVIEQAKGIIAVHRGVGMERAFELLRRHATSHGATVEETADAVVRLGLRP